MIELTPQEQLIEHLFHVYVWVYQSRLHNLAARMRFDLLAR